MVKSRKNVVMNRLQSAARLSRTVLAARLNGHGFYAGQDQIMLALNNLDGQSPSELATRLGVRPPTITKTINRLQAQGVLEKRASQEDARQTHIFLTESGRETIKAIEKSVKKTEKQALRGLDKKEQKALSKLLSRIEANLAGAVEADADDDGEVDEGVALPPAEPVVTAKE
ncbi:MULTISPECIES: MarR family winged helix-turn-helix transcriptional regulator [Mesorhizobium]|uniref:MarR family transcriptional regulator n=1 Tax=Mesorhizobium denitrificans TaxID=2294114 RepID=A0A371XCI3_9HYPH|nr:MULTISPECIES: MarR family transcriptional regulator [Mesorhizobium]RFC66940.1 MarR family transcriptional regulator [Mesorhizobium denitrificans]